KDERIGLIPKNRLASWRKEFERPPDTSSSASCWPTTFAISTNNTNEPRVCWKRPPSFPDHRATCLPLPRVFMRRRAQSKPAWLSLVRSTRPPTTQQRGKLSKGESKSSSSSERCALSTRRL